MKSRFVSSWSIIMTSLLLMLSLATNASANAAGKARFVMGKAYIAKVGQSYQRLHSGTAINEGDKIKTLGGGHVHILFVDGGLVSVRPNSEFSIEFYQYNPEQPELSVIRFDLKKGVARSISGIGAKAARHKFRMNTPIAAIGVRGTDFVVSAQTDAVRALVNEGAIVLAPFSDHCMVDAVGPCEVNSLELTGLSDQFLEITQNAVAPTLVSRNSHIADELAVNDFALSTSSVEADEQVETAEEQTVQEETLAEEQAEIVGRDDQLREQIDLLEAETPTTTQPPEPVEPTEPEVPVVPEPAINYVPDTPLTTEQLNQRQLAWGRWGLVRETDKVIAQRNDIAQGRHVTLGNTEQALYRQGPASQGFKPDLGTVDFSLLDAQATLDTGTRIVPMQVTDGSLSINFDTREFATDLTLYTFETSDVLIQASGSINNNGIFTSSDNGQFLGGATTFDGTEASYMFTKEHQQGDIEGVTYWKTK